MPALEAPITAVTVYTDRARVIRQGKIALEPGEHTLTIERLPPLMSDDSVRVSGTGAGVTIIGVDVKREVIQTETIGTQFAALEQEKQIQEDVLETVKLRLGTLKILADQATTRFSATLASGRVTVDKVTELSDYIDGQREVLLARKRDIEARLKAIKDQLARKGEIPGWLKEQPQYQTVVQLQVALRAEVPVTFTLEASYLVSQASWKPLYDVRLRDGHEVELTYLATITQDTGEAWDNVKLALSTARPAVSVTLPELKAWYLYHRPERQPTTHIRGLLYEFADDDDSRAAGETPDFNSMSAEETMQWMESLARRQGATEGFTTSADLASVANIETAQVAASGAAVTYGVGTPVTIPSDGSPHKTAVAITRLSAKLDYLSVPKIALEAYLRATITNTSEYTLLPGQVSIFHGDEFVGKTMIPTIAPGEEFEVSLGVDERIKIERELVNREVSRRFIGSNRRIVYAYKITVTNLLPEAATVTISDGIPVSQHESIKIQREKIVPAPTEQTELNVLSWTLELAAGASQEILLSFTVEHPRDMVISGLVE